MEGDPQAVSPPPAPARPQPKDLSGRRKAREVKALPSVHVGTNRGLMHPPCPPGGQDVA